MRKFSERKGLVPVSEVIQTGDMREPLRNSIWNTLDVCLWSIDGYIYAGYGQAEAYIIPFSRALWSTYFKKTIDKIPLATNFILLEIRNYFFDCKWYEVYDFIEFVCKFYSDARVSDKLRDGLNTVLERELSGYRLIGGFIVEITQEQEVEMLQSALEDTRFAPVNAHLQRSLELLSARENPDYRNSIKESISAVESMARLLIGDDKATLGDALRQLEKNGKLHSALKNGFSSIYGYTNDADGIRHSMMEMPNLSGHDAKFFLLSCTSFINYLKTKM